jgi:predicted enzyme related to lactoylglutathione lyase
MATSPTPHLPGKFVWYEYASPDEKQARAFYEPLLNWHVEKVPMGAEPYPLIMLGEDGIGGLTASAKGERAHWISYLSVDDVDARHAKALAAGGKSSMPPTDFAPVGRGAAITDPAGAPISLWKSVNGDRVDQAEAAVGDWVWNELWTPDPTAALAFYKNVFGFGHDSMPMPGGEYLMLKSADGKSRAGITPGRPEAPPLWLPYLKVADCDATVAKAQSLGARAVLMPPTDIPGVGRFAILEDNQGAAIAVIKMMPMQQS